MRFGARTRQTPQRESAQVRNWLGPLPVVESVQRGLITIADVALANTGAIAAVDASRSYVRITGYEATTPTVNQAARLASVRLTSATVVTASRGAADGAGGCALTVAYEVVQYRYGWLRSLQQVTVALAAGVLTNTAALATALASTSRAELVQRGLTSTALGAATEDQYALDQIASTTTVSASRLGLGGDLTAHATVAEYA